MPPWIPFGERVSMRRKFIGLSEATDQPKIGCRRQQFHQETWREFEIGTRDLASGLFSRAVKGWHTPAMREAVWQTENLRERRLRRAFKRQRKSDEDGCKNYRS